MGARDESCLHTVLTLRTCSQHMLLQIYHVPADVLLPHNVHAGQPRLYCILIRQVPALPQQWWGMGYVRNLHHT